MCDFPPYFTKTWNATFMSRKYVWPAYHMEAFNQASALPPDCKDAQFHNRPFQTLKSSFSHSTEITAGLDKTRRERKKRPVQPLHDCWTISNDPGLKPSSWDHEKNHHSDLKGRLKLPVAPFYLHCPISKGENKKGSFFIQPKTWVALWHNTLFQWGPEDLLECFHL